MTPVHAHLVLEHLFSLRAIRVLPTRQSTSRQPPNTTNDTTHPRIRNPTIRLHQRRRSEILVLVPPIRRTTGRTTRTENAFVQPIQLLAVLGGLQKLALFRGGVVLEIGFDRFVLLVKEGEVWDEVLDDVH